MQLCSFLNTFILQIIWKHRWVSLEIWNPLDTGANVQVQEFEDGHQYGDLGECKRLIKNLSSQGVVTSLVTFNQSQVAATPEAPDVVASVRRLQTSDKTRVVLMFDPSLKSLLKKHSDLGTLNDGRQWIILVKPEHRAIFDSIFSELQISVDSEVIVGDLGPDGTIELTMRYSVAPGFPINRERYGYFNGSVVSFYDLPFIYERRSNLQDVKLRALGVDAGKNHFIVYQRDAKGNITGVTGGMFDEVFLTLQKTLNFSFSLEVLPGFQYGTFKNGSWNGKCGRLASGESDITVSELAIIPERAVVLDYSFPVIYITNKLFLSTNAETETIDWDAFIQPLSFEVYPVLLVMGVSIAFFLWCTGFILEKTTPQAGLDRLTVAESLWTIISSVCNQGCEWWPKSWSTRIVFFLCYAMFFMVFNGYSGDLTAFLTVKKDKMPFKDLEGILDSSYDIGTIKNDLNQVNLELAEPGTIMNQIWEQKLRDRLNELTVNNVPQGITKVLESRYVFFTLGIDVYSYLHANERAKCAVEELAADYNAVGLGIGMRKNFPYKKLIDHQLLKMKASGQLDRIRRTKLPTKPVCFSRNTILAGLFDLATAFIMLILGAGAAVFTLGLEWAWMFSKRLKDRQTQQTAVGSAGDAWNTRDYHGKGSEIAEKAKYDINPSIQPHLMDQTFLRRLSGLQGHHK